jgi:uncharacterized phage protein (TIGR01671 family)
MREIKFRGLRVNSTEWVYGSLVNNLWNYSEMSDFPQGTPVCEIITGKYEGDCWTDVVEHEDGAIVTVIPNSVGQFTGLKDKNGREIYENDLILDALTKVVYNIKIGFCKKHGFVGVYGESVNIEGRVTPIAGDYGGDNNSQIEVIGNIYQNPELLTN